MSSPAPVHDESPNLAFVVMIAGAAALGGFLFGFDTAVISGAVVAVKNEFAATGLQIGLAVSLALLGSAAGALAAGPVADRIGRTRTMSIAALLFLISAVGTGMPSGLIDFILWRILGGIGVGAASVIAPAYIAEVSPAAMRGRLASLQQLAIVTGIFVAMLSDFGIAAAAGGSAEGTAWFSFKGWQWMFWSEIPTALLYGLFSLFIPESPRYLVAKGKDDEAAAVLERVLGGDATQKVNEIKASIDLEHKPSFSDLRGRYGLQTIVWIGMGLSMLQQFIGINVIFYYGTALWRVVGFSEENALQIAVITGIVNIITTLIAIRYVDRWGRKPLLVIGSIGMTLTLGVLTYIFGSAEIDPQTHFPMLSDSAGIVALVAANLYVFSFGFSWGPVVWVLLGEMFPNRIRGAALSLAASMQWIANFLVSTSFPPLTLNFGLGIAYGIYAFFALLSIFFVVFFIKETKGRELEEM
ncbi:MAG: sugar porter family MFS transporter [Thermodesulfobacteriota bacterium]